MAEAAEADDGHAGARAEVAAERREDRHPGAAKVAAQEQVAPGAL